MRRKDCDKSYGSRIAAGVVRSARTTPLAWLTAIALCASGAETFAGTVRLWSSAVVVGDTVQLSDVSELTGFHSDSEQMLTSLVLMSAPPVGGSRVIHMDMVRSALREAGANLSQLTLRGAMQCAVSRPSQPVTPPVSTGRAQEDVSSGHPHRQAGAVPSGSSGPADKTTLRQAVIDYFDREFARYGGKAEVLFDRTSEQILDLAGPEYQFNVRRRNGSALGLTPLEVDVVAGGRVVQTVPLVVQVNMSRRCVAARRSINQNATIRASDVDMVTASVTRVDKLGVGDVGMVIGQRAKRFVPAGTLIEPSMLESVPLVRRGDIVRLASVVGAIRVVTSARATEDGLLGDVITVRAADNKRVEFEAVVVGPQQVQIGAGSAGRLPTALAQAGGAQ
ncbi:MAG: flagellar basal body P-ring formation protein FlgA [Phycisphaerales bacterium]|nr:MAG: flagellar basal body P-ring formation protein FlgA [Phycisphaerales bacterium]